jgi:hypothetical protein
VSCAMSIDALQMQQLERNETKSRSLLAVKPTTCGLGYLVREAIGYIVRWKLNQEAS